MSVVHASRGFLEPPEGMLKSEPAIIAGIAKATLAERSAVDWDAFVDNYDLIRDAIEKVFPDFESYNARIRKQAAFNCPTLLQCGYGRRPPVRQTSLHFRDWRKMQRQKIPMCYA